MILEQVHNQGFIIMDTAKSKNGLSYKTLDELEDKWFGPVGSPARTQYELELRMELLSEAIKQTRKNNHLTQEELGQLVGVKKSQISKLENNPSNVTFDTIIKVFTALGAKIKFRIETEGMPDIAI